MLRIDKRRYEECSPRVVGMYETPNGGWAWSRNAPYKRDFENDTPTRQNKRQRLDYFREQSSDGKYILEQWLKWDGEEFCDVRAWRLAE